MCRRNWESDCGGDRRHNCGSEIFVRDVVLNDEGGTGFLDLVADGGIGRYKPDLPSAGKAFLG